jgi:small conductance mechanosensitive channel
LNLKKTVNIFASVAAVVFFVCNLFVTAFAAGKAVPAPSRDLTSSDIYVQLAAMAKDLAIENGPHILLALVLLVVGRLLAKWITAIAQRGFQRANVERTLRGFLGNLIYYALMVGVLIAAAGEVGIQTTSFLAILGAAGLAIGLALKDSLSNFASGVMLILFRPFTVGDFVTAGGVTGKVEQITLFSTIMHTPDNQKQIVPNAGITKGVITNVNAEPIRRIDLLIGIGYDDDIRLAKTTLEDLAKAELRVLIDPAPAIGVSELGDSSVKLYMCSWVKTEDYGSVRSDLMEAIKLSFEQKGISFPYPQRDVHIYQSTDYMS